MKKEIKEKIYKILVEAYNLRKSTSPFSDQESEFDLPHIDMVLTPKILELFQAQREEIIKEIEKKFYEWVSMIPYPDPITQQEDLITNLKEV